MRGGYSLVYDRIGLALAQNFDAYGSFGLSTAIDSAYAGTNEDDPSVRFQGIDVCRRRCPLRRPEASRRRPRR